MKEAEKSSSFRDLFNRFARATSDAVGSVWAFLLALGTVLVWGVTGPIFGFSDTWQLVINTGTTIVTFIMVFLIQSTQNRDAKAVHLKLDELIRALGSARNNLLDLEELPEEQLKVLAEEFASLQKRANSEMQERRETRQDRDTEAALPVPESEARPDATIGETTENLSTRAH